MGSSLLADQVLGHLQTKIAYRQELQAFPAKQEVFHEQQQVPIIASSGRPRERSWSGTAERRRLLYRRRLACGA